MYVKSRRSGVRCNHKRRTQSCFSAMRKELECSAPKQIVLNGNSGRLVMTCARLCRHKHSASAFKETLLRRIRHAGPRLMQFFIAVDQAVVPVEAIEFHTRRR